MNPSESQSALLEVELVCFSVVPLADEDVVVVVVSSFDVVELEVVDDDCSLESSPLLFPELF